MKPRIHLLAADVDNTLYDWVRAWAHAVRPMIRRVAAHRRWPEDEAERRIAGVHVRWEATECPACLATLMPDERDRAVREAIVRAFERDFIAARPVYDGVAETLDAAARAGARVVAYSESPVPFAAHRLRLLGLAPGVHALYAREAIRDWRPFEPWTQATRAVPVPRALLKPDPSILRRIAEDAGVELSRVLYVGDNLWKDVRMAGLAGVHSAWARYGTRRRIQDEALLGRLCHWTSDDTAVERRAEGVRPGAVLDRLQDVFAHFDFGPH